jgi:TonB family protein
MRILESWILCYLVNSLWQIPLLLAAGWAAAWGLRKLGTSAEHRIWVSVLLLQIFLPACSMLPWEWLRALCTWRGGALHPGDASVSTVMGGGIGLRAWHLPSGLLTAATLAYAAATAYFVVRFVLRCRRLGVLRSNATEIVLDGEAALAWEQCAERFGVYGVSVAASSQIFGPVTMGLSQKLILLPENMASGLAASEIRAVIAHECAHLHRRDFLKNLIYEFLSLPASYHPLLWLTREHITETREMICDELAAEEGTRSQYARSLLRLASMLVNDLPIRAPHAIGIFDANMLERRIMKLTEKKIEIRGVRRVALVFACAMLAIGTCASGLAFGLTADTTAAIDDTTSGKSAGTVDVSAKVMAGLVLTKVPPKYPADAKTARIQGKVVLSAVIGKDGTVEKLTVVSGRAELQQSSLDAVRQWTYKPFLVNGDPVEVKTTVNVIYSLSK